MDLSRRNFLKLTQAGIGAAALSPLMAGNDDVMLARQAHFPAKAKNVIYLHMAGSPTQLDLFDYKTELLKYSGTPVPAEHLKGRKFAFTSGVPKLMGTPRTFKQHGESGGWFSDAIPGLASIADELTFIHTMKTDQFNHAPAQLFLQTGFSIQGRPCIGSWMTYGLGTQNQDLPGFVVMVSGGSTPSAGKAIWSSGFIPSVYQGVQCRSKGDPVLYVKDPEGLDRELRRIGLDGINDLNRLQQAEMKHPETLTRMAQYELAYRMQVSVPEVMDLNKESKKTLEEYGAVPGAGSFANNCLLARRLVENGVRFVQLYDWGWDMHGTNPKEDIRDGLTNKARPMDKSVTALIKDLKQRGLLESTLVVWGGEFGRTPFREGRTSRKSILGRDHYPDCFTLFMAGAGVKSGYHHGESDDLGFNVADKDKQVHVHDFQATLMHLMGFDHEKLTYRFQGRDYRLSDVHGHVVKDILA